MMKKKESEWIKVRVSLRLSSFMPIANFRGIIKHIQQKCVLRDKSENKKEKEKTVNRQNEKEIYTRF